MTSNKKSVIKKILFSALCLFLAVLLAAGGYVGYILHSYYRIGDVETRAGEKNSDDLLIYGGNASGAVKLNEIYTATTYNVGFGAYSQDYTFFLDEGYDEEGNPTCGYYSKARSKEEVLFNTNGAIATIRDANADFAFFQEVDVKATRSKNVNQSEMLRSAFPSYDSTFAVNFHSAFLPYPLYDMHGSVLAGLSTLSRFPIQSAYRKSFTVSDSLSKLFDLDRCFSVSLVPVENGKTLYLVNVHMSAYDEGGQMRAKQRQELSDYLNAAYEAGGYVIVGGDFNHDLLTYNPDYDYNTTDNRPFAESKKAPDWLSYCFEEDGSCWLSEHFQVIASDNAPSCRNNDIPWEEGKTFVTTVDGFILSDNIELLSHENMQTKEGKLGTDGFAYSDHEPAKITFRLQ